jgi:hypothetical protein
MRMNELVELYQLTRDTAAVTGTWRLRRWARRERRVLEQDDVTDADRMRLAAIEDELAGRDRRSARTLLMR